MRLCESLHEVRHDEDGEHAEQGQDAHVEGDALCLSQARLQDVSREQEKHESQSRRRAGEMCILCQGKNHRNTTWVE